MDRLFSYYTLIALIPYTIYFSIEKKFKSEKFYEYSFLSVMILLLMFSGFRGNGDVDYFKYKEYTLLFTDFNALINIKFLEPGFKILSYISNSIGFDPQFVIFSMNFISLTSLYFFIKKCSLNYMLSLIVFMPLYMQLDMHSARTAVAVSIGVWSYYFSKEGKLFLQAATIVGATLFHTSALILLFTYLYNLDIFKKFVQSKNVLIFLGVSWVFKHLISFVSILKYLLTTFGLDKLNHKLTTYSSGQFGSRFSLLDPRLLLSVFIFVCLWYVVNKKDSRNDASTKEIDILLVYAFIGTFIYIFASDITIVTVRFSHYFNIFMIVSVPILFSLLKKMELKYNFFISSTFLFVYFLYTVIVMPKVPYYIFF